MEEKILILKKTKNSLFFYKINEVEQYWSKYFKNKILRKIFISNPLLFPICFGKWTKKINVYDKIILFDSGYDKNILKYIREKNQHAKVILWYWNSLEEYNNTIIKDEGIDEVWTYNRFDAEKFRLHYNSQFYSVKVKLPKNRIRYDIVFLGRDKGRLHAINELKREWERNGLICNFKVIQREKDFMCYKKYLNLISQSKCILDFNNTSHLGLTLRPLEALFLKKKLITNNKDIIHYDFYHPNNIFVLGVNDEKEIKDFLQIPYKEVSPSIINKYDFESWKNRFK